jgi:hypothetical protein
MTHPIFLILLLFAALFTLAPGLPPSYYQKAQILPSPQASVEAEDTVETPTVPSQPTTQPVTKPKTTKSSVFIDTFITSGPEQGEIIEETNRVTFEFDGVVSPQPTKGKITFETKVLGSDEKWRLSYAKKRTITLPHGPKEYTFLVRAKINNIVDLTPAKRTFKINTSPYFGKVKISSVQTKTSSRSSLVKLTTYLKNDEIIKFSGWRLQGKAGTRYILKGIEKYKPAYGLYPNEVIFLERGDTVYISGEASPLGNDINFRPNKCMGYLTHTVDFPITIQKNCPKPTKEEIAHFDACCQEFILGMRKCEIPDYPINLFDNCKVYLDKNFDYEGCFANYSSDEDFLTNQWHIYLNYNIVVSDSCDILYLRDRNGLFVDKHSYGRAVCR